MKNSNLDLFKNLVSGGQPTTYCLWVVLGVAVFLIAKFFYKNKKIEEAFVKAGFGDEKNKKRNGKDSIIQRFKYFEFKNKLFIYKFSKSFTTFDFYKKIQLFNELFEADFIEFQRNSRWVVTGIKANWKRKFKLKNDDICIGTDGKENLTLDKDQLSIFCFGIQGSGKTVYLKSLIRQIERVYKNNEKIVISAKPSDFSEYNCLSYNDEKILIEKLKEILEQISTSELLRKKLDKTYIIFCDECQFLMASKEACQLITSIVRISRSHGLFILLATQSGKITELSNLPISLMSVKICVRNTESLQFAESIFNSDIAEQSYRIPVEKGFGFIRTTTHRSRKVKFYYE